MQVLLIADLLFTSVLVSDKTRAELPDMTDGYLCNGQCGPGNACATIDQDGDRQASGVIRIPACCVRRVANLDQTTTPKASS